MGSVDESEKTMQGEVPGPSTIPDVEVLDDIRPPGHHQNKRFLLDEMKAILESAGMEYIDVYQS